MLKYKTVTPGAKKQKKTSNGQFVGLLELKILASNPKMLFFSAKECNSKVDRQSKVRTTVKTFNLHIY